MFCPNGATTVFSVSVGIPVSISLTSADPNAGVIRLAVRPGSIANVAFGPTSGPADMLVYGTVELLKIPAGATALTISSATGALGSVTVGQKV